MRYASPAKAGAGHAVGIRLAPTWTNERQDRRVGVSIAAAIGAAAAWFLEWPSATSAAVGAVLVPLVAVATGVVSSGRRISPGTQPPPRGVCECGTSMSMHCASDGSGPCAPPIAPAPGATAPPPRNRHKMWG